MTGKAITGSAAGKQKIPANVENLAQINFQHSPDLAAVEHIIKRWCPEGAAVIDPYPDPQRAFVLQRLGRRVLLLDEAEAADPRPSFLLWMPSFPDTGEEWWYPKEYLPAYVDLGKRCIRALRRPARIAALVSERRHNQSRQLYGFEWHTLALMQETGARLAEVPVFAAGNHRHLSGFLFDV